MAPGGRVPSPWMTPRLLKLRGALAVCAALDAVALFALLAFVIVPARTTDLLLALLDWTGGGLGVATAPGLQILALVVAAVWLLFAIAAWANPRRHAIACRLYGDTHLLAAACGAAAIVWQTPLDLAAWACVLQGSLVASLVRWRWKAAVRPILRERDAELRRADLWSFDRLAGASSDLLDAVLSRGLGPTASDLVGIEYRALRLHPLMSLFRRPRVLMGFYSAPGGPDAEGYRIAAEAATPDAPFRPTDGPRVGAFTVRGPYPGEPLPHSVVFDGPSSRRNLPGDLGARLVLFAVMPRSGDARLLLARARLRLGPLWIPAGHVVLKAWRRHGFEGSGGLA
jgi:hypothetical protein